MALIVLKVEHEAGEALAQQLFQFCCRTHGLFQSPAYMLFVDSLPTTSSQKIQKVKLFRKASIRAHNRV